MDSLQYLLAPLAVREFMTEYWERRPWYVDRRCHTYYDGCLSLEDIWGLLSRGNLQYPTVRVFHKCSNLWPSEFSSPWNYGHQTHEMIDPGKLRALLARGATINIRGLERSVPTIVRLSQSVEMRLKLPVHITGFVTPANAHNTPPHYDTVDAFILQISGAKRWRLWENPVPLPLNHQNYESRPGPKVSELQSIGDFFLKAGDLLYVPRGCYHEVSTEGEHSLHLVLGVNVQRWFDVFQMLLQRAVNQLRRKEIGRKALAPALRHDVNETDLQTASHLIEEFRQFVAEEESRLQLDAVMLDGRHHGRSGQLGDIDRLRCAGRGMRVQLREDSLYRVRCDASVVEIATRGQRLEFPIRFLAVVRELLSGEVRRIFDVSAGVTAVERVEVVNRLTVAGLIRVVSDEQAN